MKTTNKSQPRERERETGSAQRSCGVQQNTGPKGNWEVTVEWHLPEAWDSARTAQWIDSKERGMWDWPNRTGYVELPAQVWPLRFIVLLTFVTWEI